MNHEPTLRGLPSLRVDGRSINIGDICRSIYSKGGDIITTNSPTEARFTDRHANQHEDHIHPPQYGTFSNDIAYQQTEHHVQGENGIRNHQLYSSSDTVTHVNTQEALPTRHVFMAHVEGGEHSTLQTAHRSKPVLPVSPKHTGPLTQLTT